jgi:hydrogenase maturation protein HypF
VVVIMLPWSVAPTLAVGAGASALGVGRRAWSGSFPSPDAALRSLAAAAGVAPELVAVDLHPGDPARSWAARLGLPVRAVARHHALIAAVLAAHGLGPDEQAIGFAFDRGGYGPDGATWGGEVLVAGYKGARRFAHLGYVRCAGTAPDRPHRAALAHLRHAGVPWDLDLPPVRACSNRERRVLAHQLETGYGCATTSSLGQLLDAIASLLSTATTPSDRLEGVAGRPAVGQDKRRPTAGPEGGQPAVGQGGDGPGLGQDASSATVGGEGDPYPMVGLDPGPLVRAVVDDVRRRVPAEIVAGRVRATIAALVAGQARRCADETGLDVVVLAGDVFDDAALAAAVREALDGFTVLAGRPPLALGRLLCAAAG